MRVAYFDCPSGAAGDMIMASLLDAGVPLAALKDGLEKLALGGWDLRTRQVMKGAFRATKVDVEIDRSAHQHQRSLRDILQILEASGLAPSVKERAGRIFTRLADAEARVHGTSRESVHFHEVGAVDAIVDVTGGVLALTMLGIDAVYVRRCRSVAASSTPPTAACRCRGPARPSCCAAFRSSTPACTRSW